MTHYFKKGFLFIIALVLVSCGGHQKANSHQEKEFTTMEEETAQLQDFVKLFFADSIFQREHVSFPLILQYWVEQEYNGEYSYEQDSVIIEENDYQILFLDSRSEIKICEEESERPYIVVSIPDTALEAKLYFRKNNGSYLLSKMNITGDASPF